MEIKPNEQMKAKTGTDRWKHKHIKEVKFKRAYAIFKVISTSF